MICLNDSDRLDYGYVFHSVDYYSVCYVHCVIIKQISAKAAPRQRLYAPTSCAILKIFHELLSLSAVYCIIQNIDLVH